MIAAHATNPTHDDALARAAVAQVQARTGGQPFGWRGDGWREYRPVLTQACRRVVRDGRLGRPPRKVPDEWARTQRIKRCEPRGRLLSFEVKATIGTPIVPPGTTRVV